MIPIKSKKIIYLVDYENVGPNRFCDFIQTVEESNQIVVFYSGDHNTINFDDISRCNAPLDFIKIHNGVKNALDFQLASFMGYHIAQNADDENVVYNYIIVSNDKGFKCLSLFWRDRHVNVGILQVGEQCDDCISSNIDAKSLIDSIGVSIPDSTKSKKKSKSSHKKKKSKKAKKSEKQSNKITKKQAKEFEEELKRLKTLPQIKDSTSHIEKLMHKFADDREMLYDNKDFHNAFKQKFKQFVEPVAGSKWKNICNRFTTASSKDKFENRLRDDNIMHPDLANYIIGMLRHSDFMFYIGCLNKNSSFYTK